MAQYVLAGVAQCPNFARAEILADDLSINLPDFNVHKIVLSDSEWKTWLNETCSKHGWKHESSPLVWRELVDRGGSGTYLGGWDDFKKMTEHWYGYSDKLAAGLVTEVAAENKVTHQKDEAASVKTPIVPVRVCVVGAAQPLAYSLVPLFFDSCFTDVPLAIVLHDAKEHTGTLEGLSMEILDLSYSELHSVTICHDLKAAAKNADYVIILDPVDTSSHSDRFLLIKAVNTFYKEVAASLKDAVKGDCKVVINGYKGCLGGMLLQNYGVKCQNITVVTALDEQRLRAKLAKRLKVLPSDISDITVWGNIPIHHVASPAIATVSNHEGAITGPDDYNKTVFEAVNENDWESSNVDARNDRDSQILTATGHKSNMASALAIYRHVAALVGGSDGTTMACVSGGEYGTTPGVVFGFPVVVSQGVVQVREVDLASEKVHEMIKLQNNQLLVEKQVALGECDNVEKALQMVEGVLWTILETPKLQRTLEEKETERVAAEEAEKKAAEVRAKEEAKKKAEEDALKQAAAEAAAAAAAVEDDGEFDDDA